MIVSDRYAAYAFVDPARRRVCRAHLVCDFKRISDRCGRPGRIGRTLLAAASQRDLPQLDEKLYLKVFAPPKTPASRRTAPTRQGAS